jgi:hypothetical protein
MYSQHLYIAVSTSTFIVALTTLTIDARHLTHVPQPHLSWLPRLSPIALTSHKLCRKKSSPITNTLNKTAKKKSIAMHCIGIAEGGARTLDLEVWNIMR